MKSTSLPALAARLSAVSLAAFALHAGAQAPGAYTGQNAQGQAMRVTVAIAPDGVSREIVTIETSYRLTCELPGPRHVGLASVVSGHFPIDAGGAFVATYLWDRDYFRTSGTFAADGSVAGATEWALAGLIRKAPYTAEVCASPALGWSASAGAAAMTGAALRPDLRIELQFDRAGRLTGETLRDLR